MSDVSDLERKMMECDKHCADHHTTVEALDKMEKCMFGTKERIDKLKNKSSWIMGVLFFAALMLGYTLNGMSDINALARRQEGKNQQLAENCIQVQKLTTAQRSADITFAQIKNDLRYMKRDITEIKQILKKKRM